MPRTAIVILSHRAELLSRAFGSAHAQTYPDKEIIVKYSDTPWWPEKINEAVRGSDSEYFAILCDDDTLRPDFLTRTVEAADEAHADIAYTDHKVKHDLIELNWQLPAFSLDVLKTSCVPHFTALTRRDLFERVGGYDGTQKHADWDFWLRCAKAGATAVHVPAFCWTWTAGAQNSSSAAEFVGDKAVEQLRRKHPEVIAFNAGREKLTAAAV